MSKIVRVQGSDYKIIVGDSTNPGNIVLDTNPTGLVGAQGQVRITGDLVVLGNTTTVDSETLSIKDNIIYINVGETANGVATLGNASGIQVDRGNYVDVSFLWDETINNNTPSSDLVLTTEENGAFIFRDANLNLRPIVTNQVNTRGEDLNLVTQGNGVISVSGTVNYETRVLDYARFLDVHDIVSVSRSGGIATIITATPHGLATNDRVDVTCYTDGTFNGTFLDVLTVPTSNSFTFPNVQIPDPLPTTPATGIIRPNIIIDDDYIPNMRAVSDYTLSSLSTYASNRIQENDTKVQAYDFSVSGVSEITFEVDGNEQAVISNNGLRINNVVINNNNITSTSADDNLLIDSVLNLQNKTFSVTPSYNPGYVRIYSTAEPGTGGTGLYFVNSVENDELISKRKALLYSLIL